MCYQWVISGLSEGYQRVINGLSVGYQRVISGLEEGYQRVIRGLSEELCDSRLPKASGLVKLTRSLQAASTRWRRATV